MPNASSSTGPTPVPPTPAPWYWRSWVREIFVFAGALLIYEASRALVIGSTAKAFSNAADVVNAERSSGLFVELWVQQWLLGHMSLTKALDDFYMTGHWVVTPLFFVWLFRTRRSLYPYIRNAFLAANGIALSIFVVFPVAPPRLLTSNGFVDTLGGISKVHLHGGALSGWFNPYAAMPSMHFGYAFMIGVVVLLLARTWAVRALALAYPVLVGVTIIGTGNHYIADCAVGCVVMGTGFLAVEAWTAIRPQLTSLDHATRGGITARRRGPR
jgi:hypothetical protein